MTTTIFQNIVSGKKVQFSNDAPTSDIALGLSRVDSRHVWVGSVSNCLAGRRSHVGNWKRVSAPIKPATPHNVGTNRTQSKSTKVRVANRSEALARLEKAYEVALQTGNRRLAETLRPMILAERAKSVKASQGSDVNTVSRPVRAVANPRTMSKKLKAELYDTRVELDGKAIIAFRFSNYQQKRRVFARA